MINQHLKVTPYFLKKCPKVSNIILLNTNAILKSSYPNNPSSDNPKWGAWGANDP